MIKYIIQLDYKGNKGYLKDTIYSRSKEYICEITNDLHSAKFYNNNEQVNKEICFLKFATATKNIKEIKLLIKKSKYKSLIKILNNEQSKSI